MNKLAAALLGSLVVSAGLWALTAPASALGARGPNRHRGIHGYCVWGGQDQAWCLRHTGHVAGRGPFGTRVCR